MIIEIDGEEYEAFKEYGEWHLTPIDPNAPEIDDVALIMAAVWQADARNNDDY